MTIETLAGEMASSFETRKRNDGESFVCLKDGSPDWMTEVVRDAHSGMLPDDWTYQAVRECVDAVAEGGEDAECPEPEIYTNALLGWLQSNLSRIARVDDAIRDGNATDLVGAIQWAQSEEYSEILSSVIEALRERAEESEDEE